MVSKKASIKEVTRLLGNLVAAFEAVLFGRLYYCHLEYDKITALKNSEGIFDTPCLLSPPAIEEHLKFFLYGKIKSRY